MSRLESLTDATSTTLTSDVSGVVLRFDIRLRVGCINTTEFHDFHLLAVIIIACLIISSLGDADCRLYAE